MLKGSHPFETCHWNIRTSGFKLECHPLHMFSRKSPWSLHSNPRGLSFFLNKSLMNSTEIFDSTWNVQSLIFRNSTALDPSYVVRWILGWWNLWGLGVPESIPLVQAHEESANSGFPSFCWKVWKPGSRYQVWNWGVILPAWHIVRTSHIVAGWLKAQKMRFLLSRPGVEVLL